jgi:hypothetical protein
MRVGEKYTFKRFNKTVGRAPVGEVVRKAGALTYFKKRDGSVVPIQTRHIKYYYIFVPYKKRAA